MVEGDSLFYRTTRHIDFGVRRIIVGHLEQDGGDGVGLRTTLGDVQYEAARLNQGLILTNSNGKEEFRWQKTANGVTVDHDFEGGFIDVTYDPVGRPKLVLEESKGRPYLWNFHFLPGSVRCLGFCGGQNVEAVYIPNVGLVYASVIGDIETPHGFKIGNRRHVPKEYYYWNGDGYDYYDGTDNRDRLNSGEVTAFYIDSTKTLSSDIYDVPVDVVGDIAAQAYDFVLNRSNSFSKALRRRKEPNHRGKVSLYELQAHYFGGGLRNVTQLDATSLAPMLMRRGRLLEGERASGGLKSHSDRGVVAGGGKRGVAYKTWVDIEEEQVLFDSELEAGTGILLYYLGLIDKFKVGETLHVEGDAINGSRTPRSVDFQIGNGSIEGVFVEPHGIRGGNYKNLTAKRISLRSRFGPHAHVIHVEQLEDIWREVLMKNPDVFRYMKQKNPWLRYGNFRAKKQEVSKWLKENRGVEKQVWFDGDELVLG